MLRADWGFFGRQAELGNVEEILQRNRWFFARVTGRRRIGKTTLIQRALQKRPELRIFYVQSSRRSFLQRSAESLKRTATSLKISAT